MRMPRRSAVALVFAPLLLVPVLSACGGKPAPTPHTVTYRVTTTRTVGGQPGTQSVDYSWYLRDDTGPGDEQEPNVSLPWEKGITVKGRPEQLALRFTDVSVAPVGNFVMTCEILVDGARVLVNQRPAISDAVTAALSPIGVECVATQQALDQVLGTRP
jgi:hypothetical protein